MNILFNLQSIHFSRSAVHTYGYIGLLIILSTVQSFQSCFVVSITAFWVLCPLDFFRYLSIWVSFKIIATQIKAICLNLLNVNKLSLVNNGNQLKFKGVEFYRSWLSRTSFSNVTAIYLNSIAIFYFFESRFFLSFFLNNDFSFSFILSNSLRGNVDLLRVKKKRCQVAKHKL